jgi:uncharacterized lipoprotein YddW (UPF0748 family)
MMEQDKIFSVLKRLLILLSSVKTLVSRWVYASLLVGLLCTANNGLGANATTLEGVFIVKTGIDETTLNLWQVALQQDNITVQLSDSINQLATLSDDAIGGGRYNAITIPQQDKKWVALVTYGAEVWQPDVKADLKKLIQNPRWVVLLLPRPTVGVGAIITRWFSPTELLPLLTPPPPAWVQTIKPETTSVSKAIAEEDDPLALGLAGKTLNTKTTTTAFTPTDWQRPIPTTLIGTPLMLGCDAFGSQQTVVFCVQQKAPALLKPTADSPIIVDSALALVVKTAHKPSVKQQSKHKTKSVGHTTKKTIKQRKNTKTSVPHHFKHAKPTIAIPPTPPVIMVEQPPVFLTGNQLVMLMQKLEFYWQTIAQRQAQHLKANTHISNLKQLSQYKAYTYESMGLLQSLGRPYNRAETQRWLDEAMLWQKRYESAYEEHLIPLSGKALQKAMSAYLQAWSYSYMPSLVPETKAVWLDRGLMVKLGSAEALKNHIQLLKRAGLTHIYVETINAGFAQYPNSQTLPEQNPLLYGWDPIAVTVQEGHRLGMKVTAWVWCFAAGNERHNRIISKPHDYPGPILSLPEMRNSQLVLSDGATIPNKQHEYWLSPASQQSQTFLINAYKEIVNRYPVDGLQLDYIRYPFQSDTQQAGWDALTKARVRDELGIELQPNVPLTGWQKDQFNQWKAAQVTAFVKKVSTELKAIRPSLLLSAAVFALPRQDRIRAIQQDWETWVQNGWIDVLVPMTYSTSPTALSEQLTWIYKAVEQGSLLSPGLGAHLLEDQGLLQQAWVTKQHGADGQTWFAASHLTQPRLALLKASTNQVPLYQFQLPLEAPSPLSVESLTLVQQVAAYRDMLTSLNAMLRNSTTGFNPVTGIDPELAALGKPTQSFTQTIIQLQTFQKRLESALGDVVYAGQPSVPPSLAAELVQEWSALYAALQAQVKVVYPYQFFTQQWLLGELKQLNLKMRYTLRRSTSPTLPAYKS